MGFCYCFIFCFCFAIILVGKRERELVALLSLSSWCLMIALWLLAVPWICLRFVIVIFPDHTHYIWVSFMRTVSNGSGKSANLSLA